MTPRWILATTDQFDPRYNKLDRPVQRCVIVYREHWKHSMIHVGAAGVGWWPVWFATPAAALPCRESPTPGPCLSMDVMTTVEQRDDEPRLHVFSVDDPGLWKFRSQLGDEEFAVADVTDEEWEAFHSAIAET